MVADDGMEGGVYLLWGGRSTGDEHSAATAAKRVGDETRDETVEENDGRMEALANGSGNGRTVDG